MDGRRTCGERGLPTDTAEKGNARLLPVRVKAKRLPNAPIPLEFNHTVPFRLFPCRGNLSGTNGHLPT